MVASLCEEVNEPAREVPRAMGMCFLIKLISYTWISVTVLSVAAAAVTGIVYLVNPRPLRWGFRNSSPILSFLLTLFFLQSSHFWQWRVFNLCLCCTRKLQEAPVPPSACSASVSSLYCVGNPMILIKHVSSRHLGLCCHWFIDCRLSLHVGLFQRWRYPCFWVVEEGWPKVWYPRQLSDTFDYCVRSFGFDLSWFLGCLQRLYRWWVCILRWYTWCDWFKS